MQSSAFGFVYALDRGKRLARGPKKLAMQLKSLSDDGWTIVQSVLPQSEIGQSLTDQFNAGTNEPTGRSTLSAPQARRSANQPRDAQRRFGPSKRRLSVAQVDLIPAIFRQLRSASNFRCSGLVRTEIGQDTWLRE
jgi:hypothetical protein